MQSALLDDAPTTPSFKKVRTLLENNKSLSDHLTESMSKTSDRIHNNMSTTSSPLHIYSADVHEKSAICACGSIKISHFHWVTPCYLLFIYFFFSSVDVFQLEERTTHVLLCTVPQLRAYSECYAPSYLWNIVQQAFYHSYEGHPLMIYPWALLNLFFKLIDSELP